VPDRNGNGVRNQDEANRRTVPSYGRHQDFELSPTQRKKPLMLLQKGLLCNKNVAFTTTRPATIPGLNGDTQSKYQRRLGTGRRSDYASRINFSHWAVSDWNGNGVRNQDEANRLMDAIRILNYLQPNAKSP
jgi:hypothetical protein